MDTTKRDELRELLATATPGPWVAAEVPERREMFVTSDTTPKRGVCRVQWGDDYLDDEDRANAYLLAVAVSALPALLDRLDALEAALAESVAYGCVAHDPHGDSDGDCDRCASLDAAEELLALREGDAMTQRTDGVREALIEIACAAFARTPAGNGSAFERNIRERMTQAARVLALGADMARAELAAERSAHEETRRSAARLVDAYREAAADAAPALLDRIDALEAVVKAATDVQRWMSEASECPCCGNDGFAENEHAAGDYCAALEAALRSLDAKGGA